MSIDIGYVAVCDGVQRPGREHKPCQNGQRTEVFPTRWEARQNAIRMGFTLLKPNYDIGDIFACPNCAKKYYSPSLLNDKFTAR
jgi:hypothetical protein